MSDLKKRFSRRDFLWIAGSTAATLPLLAACAEATEEATQAQADTGTELEAGERGGLWLPPEAPEMKEVVTSTNTPSYYTTLPWYLMNDYGFAEEEGFDKVDFIVAEGAFEGVISKDITLAANLDEEKQPLETAEHELLLIPYYAWAHRGTGEMDVWLARNTEAIKAWLQRKK